MSKVSLHKIVAVVKGAKKNWTETLTAAHRLFSKGEAFTGEVITYTPLTSNEDGKNPLLPPTEGRRPNLAVRTSLADLETSLTRCFDAVLTQDIGNTVATGNISVGSFNLTNVPVTTLLFLESQLTGIATLIKGLPVLDANETWRFDEGIAQYRTDPRQTVRNKRVKKVITKAPATDKHPAQVELLDVDEPECMKNSTRYSSAITETARREMLARVEVLQAAIVAARQDANAKEVEQAQMGRQLFEYIFGR